MPDRRLPPRPGRVMERERLARIAGAIEAGQALDHQDLAFVARAFRDVLSGIDAGVALGVASGRARPPERTEEHQRWVARVVEVLKLRDKGTTLERAISQVANAPGASFGRAALAERFGMHVKEARLLMAQSEHARRHWTAVKALERQVMTQPGSSALQRRIAREQQEIQELAQQIADELRTAAEPAPAPRQALRGALDLAAIWARGSGSGSK